MKKLLTFGKTSIFIGLLMISNIISCEAKCYKPSLDTIHRLEAYIQAIEKEDGHYSSTLSENDFTYHAVDLRGAKHRDLFKTCIAPILKKFEINKIESPLLDKLFRAVGIIAFYSQEANHARTLQAILNEAVKRKDIANNNNWPATVYKSYIKARLFKEANQLAQQFPKYTFEKLPEFNDHHRKDLPYISLMQLQNNAEVLTRDSFSIPSEGHVIVVAHPFCHFSQNALSAITSDLELKSVFINHSTWIMPSNESLDIDGVLEANNDSLIKYHYIYLESEWPEIDYWGTPAFYFYKDGKFIQKVVGWPKEGGRKKEILKALQLIGLTKPSTKDAVSSD